MDLQITWKLRRVQPGAVGKLDQLKKIVGTFVGTAASQTVLLFRSWCLHDGRIAPVVHF